MTLIGDNAANTLNGTAASESIFGLGGNDQIFGGGGNDILDGGDGNDFIDNPGGDTTLLGGSGDDQLFGSASSNDRLFGGTSNDLLDGGTGNDFMAGGGGNDVYIVDSQVDVVDEVDASANGGIDTVKSSVAFTLPKNVENLTLTGTGNTDGFGNSGNNTIIGSSGNNLLGDINSNDGADSGDDFIDGSGGVDTIVARGDVSYDLTNTTLKAVFSSTTTFTNIEKAEIVGGAGNNVLDASQFTLGDVSLFGEGGNNTLIGGSGNDFLVATDGNDRFTGGAGNNIIKGGGGVDTIREAGDFDFLVSDTRVKGNGNDTFDQIEAIELTGGSGNNTLDAHLSSSLVITLNGGDGNDKLIAGANSSTLNGGNGDDQLAVGSGKGNNQLTGGAGADQFIFNSGNAFSTSSIGFGFIKDFAHGTDKIVLDKSTFKSLQSNANVGFSPNDFAIVTSGSNLGTAVTQSNARIVFHTPTNSLIYNENGSAAGLGAGGSFAGFSGNPTLSASDFILQSGSSNGLSGTPIALGNKGSNTIVGRNIGGILDGKGGNDTLFAKGGNDVVLGGDGNDSLDGGTGDDILFGGKGKDTLKGGKGSDTFVLAPGAGVDVIKDYKDGIDKLGLVSDLSSDQLQFVQKGSSTVIRSGGQDLAVVNGVKASQLTAIDFVSIGFSSFDGMNVPAIVG